MTYAGYNATTLADRLGEIKAEIAELKKTERAMIDELVTIGETVEGEKFVATYVAGAAVWTLDKKAVEAEMGEDWITAHSKITNRKPTVRVARKLAA